MAKIYLSSTYSDLIEFRESVYDALRKMRHDVIAMEDYVATDQRPLDKCLQDVADSDLYVGIFAWRYGYIPDKDNPEQKSITELEYRQASELGRPCFIFLVAEDTSWSPKAMDTFTGDGDQGKRIKKLRQELGQEKLVNFFTTPAELASLVGAAVYNWEIEEGKKEPPPAVQESQVAVPQIPLQRPPRAEHFTDREAELKQLLAKLKPGKVVTLCGPGGIGKSALAAEVVTELPPDRFPDGSIFYSFYGKPDPALAFEHIVRSYDEAARDTSDSAAQRLLAGKQALLMLDGTEATAELGRVLAVRGGCGVLVTSRARKDAVAERQDIQPLPTAEAVELLQAWGKAQATDETAAQQICDQVGRLPLAVRLVGRYLDETEESAAEYLDWLATTPIRALSHGEHREESVEILLERSLVQVSPVARQVLGVVGLLALTPFGREVVARALEVQPGEVGQWLGELVNYGLLLRVGQRYVVSHALVHTYARRRTPPSDEMVERVATYCTELAKEQSDLGLEGYTRLDAERGHIMVVLERCVEREAWEATRGLAAATDNYLDIRGYWIERITAMEAGLVAARGLGNRRDEGNFLSKLANTYYVLGQVEQAIEYYEQALTIAREIGDPQMEGKAVGNMGLAYRALGQVERAIEFYEQALTIAREIDDRRNEGAWLGNLGNAYRALGQVERAIEFYEQTLTIAREIGDRRDEGNHIGNLGLAYSELGQVERAIEFYEQALTIAREIGDRRNNGTWLGNLANAYSALGQVERAIEFYEQALTIAREIGDRRGEAIRLHNIGNLYKDQGNIPLARQYLAQALAIFEEIKSPYTEESRRLLAELEEPNQ